MSIIKDFFLPNPGAMAQFEARTNISKEKLGILATVLIATAIAGKILGTFSNKQALLLAVAGACIYKGAEKDIVALFALPILAGVGSFFAIHHRQILNNLMPRLVFNINLF